MTNKQILRKAIEKAVSNGWNKQVDKRKLSEVLIDIIFNQQIGSIYEIIFSHDFAKAFWDKCKCKECEINNSGFDSDGNYGRYYGREWQYHLQQMVLEKEPLQYLKKFL